jgi:hypothetical protein
MPKAQSTPWARATNTAWKKAVIAVAMLAVIVLVPYGIAEYSYQQRINTLKQELERVESDALKPLSAVGTGPFGVRCPHFLDTTGWANGPCPQVSRDYSVAIDPGKESQAALMNQVLEKEGYTNIGHANATDVGRTASGVKGKISLSLEVSPFSNDDNLPHPAPSGKRWVRLYVTVGEAR